MLFRFRVGVLSGLDRTIPVSAQQEYAVPTPILKETDEHGSFILIIAS